MIYKLFNINSINNLKRDYKKIFVIVGGGSASGKNYFAKNIDLPLIDVDKENEKLNDGKVDCTKTINKALLIVKKRIKEYFEKGKSFVQVTTASDYNRVYNKFEEAKKYGFTTIFVHISCSINQAIKNNEERVKNGGHGKTLTRFKIMTTKLKSDIVFNRLKKSNLVDFHLEIKGK